MFTGLIEEMGTVLSIARNRDSMVLKIKAETVLVDSIIGDSISLSGVCQTITAIDKTSFTVDVLRETLIKSNLGKLKYGEIVNLERSLTLSRPLGGHIVQGHVQGVGVVLSLKKSGINTFLSLGMKSDLMKYMIKEGSVAIDGLSLTIAKKSRDTILLNIIPHTIDNTTISYYRVGDVVNIEPDIMVKVVIEEKSQGLTKEKLLGWGY